LGKDIEGGSGRNRFSIYLAKPGGSNANKIHKIIREVCNDIKRQCSLERKGEDVLGILLLIEMRVG
jgi:hypothetical protein